MNGLKIEMDLQTAPLSRIVARQQVRRCRLACPRVCAGLPSCPAAARHARQVPRHLRFPSGLRGTRRAGAQLSQLSVACSLRSASARSTPLLLPASPGQPFCCAQRSRVRAKCRVLLESARTAQQREAYQSSAGPLLGFGLSRVAADKCFACLVTMQLCSNQSDANNCAAGLGPVTPRQSAVRRLFSLSLKPSR